MPSNAPVAPSHRPHVQRALVLIFVILGGLVLAATPPAHASTTIGHQLTLISTGTRDCTATSESSGGLIPVTVTITNTVTSDSYDMRVDTGSAQYQSASDDHDPGTGSDTSDYVFHVFVSGLGASSQNVFIYGSGNQSNDITVNAPACANSTPPQPTQQAPVVSLSATPTSDTVGSYVSATLTDATNENNGNTSDSFAWGDGSPNTVGTDTYTQHQYNVAGTYTVTGCITNSAGTSCASASVQIVVPPAAPAPTTFRYAVKGLSVTLTSNQPARGTPPFGYAWTFGDSGPFSYDAGMSVSHTYSHAGKYNVTLTVHNAVAAVATSQTVTVLGTSPTLNKVSSVATVTKALKGEGIKVGNTILPSGALAPKNAPKGYKLVVVGYKLQPVSKKMTISVTINGKKVKEKVPAYSGLSASHSIPLGDTVALVVKLIKA